MAFDLTNFQDPQLDIDYLTYLVDQQSDAAAAHYAKCWNYYRNPSTPAVGLAANALNANSRPYIQAQEVGLPARITGVQRVTANEHLTDMRRKEVVIENDIAWRINTMVDFLFGQPITVRSLASDPELAKTIESVIATLLDTNNGLEFLQETALLGAVNGFVDIALRIPAGVSTERMPSPPGPSRVRSGDLPSSLTPHRPGTSENNQDAAGVSFTDEDEIAGPVRTRSRIDALRAIEFARSLHLETIEAGRVLPILAENDFHHLRYWIQRYHKHPARLTGRNRPWWHLGRMTGQTPAPVTVEVIEILGITWWQRYEDRQLIAEGPNLLGRPPVVHIPNLSAPNSYEGLSDVEPLIPLQDELNTRLSDRAHRVTYQSFKMYLGKGIDDFLERPVGPGQMWATQNPAASIEEFGSDSASPSEDAHIEQIRQAMDKISRVPPLAAGLIHGNVGNLTSATALKVLLSGLLARTAKKRLTYGTGFQKIVELALAYLDVMGVLKTDPSDRRIEIHWPSPLPVDEEGQLRNAQIKAQLGVPTDRILEELGYERRIINQS